jgi:uncharacterized protein YyaL (SSP411 family)
LLNRGFVSVKVDREERPDVDHFYMQACQRLSGRGGWPLTALLAPDRRPFFAGTYYPKEGLVPLLSQALGLWHSDRAKLLGEAAAPTGGAAARASPGSGGVPDTEEAAGELMRLFDPVNGGFGGAPKFPAPHNLLFLMRAARSEPPGSEIWRAVGKTLRSMARGGLRDHLGGGFCRYSTDAKWLLPHFEKMLYDNALLLLAYAEHHQKTGDTDSAAIVRETAEYVLREMTDARTGVFFTAQDADAAGGEGLFYTFTPEEVRSALGGEAQRFCETFDIRPGGHLEGRSVPNLLRSDAPLFDPELAAPRRRMFDYRAGRPAPFRDEKALLSSNGLMVAALARAGYRDAAARAARFLLRNMRGEDGRMLAVYAAGHAHKPATLDGYACLIWGLLELHQADFGPAWLREAEALTRAALELFEGENGGLYFAGHDVADLPGRGVNAWDGAVPSGQSVMAMNLVRLSRLLENDEFEQRARALIGSLAGDAARSPPGFPWLLAAGEYLQDGGVTVTITGSADVFLRALGGYRPYLTVRLEEGEGPAAARVCTNKTCFPPAATAEELEQILNGGISLKQPIRMNSCSASTSTTEPA